MARQRKSSVGATSSSASIAGDADATAGLKPKRARKSAPRECPSQRTSVYRGVTRHRWTGRFEAHLWDKNTWSESQRKKKGRQVYLGAYGGEEAAARAYDLAALKYWGRDTILNFPLANYDQELKEMEEQSREEYIGSLRRKSTGFSRGVSKYRGVARHHHNGKWEARIGRVFGNKYLYLGTYATQEEAAMAYDIAAIEHRGLNAVTNFDVSRYIKWHHLCRAGDADGLHDPGQLPIDHVAPHPSVDLDEAMAVAALHDDDQLLLPTEVSPPSHAALGLLLQSPGFKEMLELTAASESRTLSPSSSSCSPSPPPPSALTQQQLAEYSGNASSAWCSFTTSESSTISPSSSSCSPTPPPPPALTQQQLPEYSGSASSAPCSFPDDVQTYFGFEDHDGGVGYPEVDTFLFGDLGAYAAPMFQFELDL